MCQFVLPYFYHMLQFPRMTELSPAQFPLKLRGGTKYRFSMGFECGRARAGFRILMQLSELSDAATVLVHISLFDCQSRFSLLSAMKYMVKSKSGMSKCTAYQAMVECGTSDLPGARGQRRCSYAR